MYSKAVYRIVILLTGFHIELDWTRKTSDYIPLQAKHNFVSGLEDEQILQCPYLSTCAYNLSVDLTNPVNNLTDRCCLPCGSDVNRQKMKCCESIMPCVHLEINEDNQQLACIPTNFKKKMTDRDIGVLSVVTCSNGSDEDEAAKCVQDYQSGYARYGEDYTGGNVDVYDIIPVIDVNTHAVYRNIHCAFCNGVEADFIKYWLLNVICGKTSNIDVREDVDILAAVRSNNNCDIRFINPDPDVTTRQCVHVIDKCNVTGLWLYYIRKEERDCHSKPTVYATKSGMVFKNQECAFCNGMQFGSTGFNLKIPSLSLLLSLKKRPRSNDQTASVCPRGNIYQKAEGRCVEARCSLLRRLNNNVCERTIHSVEALSYRIGLRLTTDVVITIQAALNIVQLLQEPVYNLLLSVFGSLGKIVFNLFLVADLEYTHALGVSEISQANLLWFDLRLKLTNVELQDPEEKLEMLLRLSRNMEIGLNVTDGIVVNLKVKPMDGVMYAPHELPDISPCNYNFVRFDLCSDLSATQNTKMVPRFGNFTGIKTQTAVRYAGYEELTFAHDIFYSTPIDYERNILEFRRCPFIKVILNNVSDWKESRNGLQFVPKRFEISLSDFIYGGNEGGIWVCANIYNALLNSGNMNQLCRTCYVCVAIRFLNHYSLAALVYNIW